MTSKANFTSTEWQQLRDGPDWVFAALAAADGNAAAVTKLKESGAFKTVMKEYSSGSALVKDVIADKGKPAKAIKGATLSDAEQAIAGISALLAKKADAPDANLYRHFLTSIANSVAEAAGEGALGLGAKVSKNEKAALDKIVKALKAPAPAKPAAKSAPPKPAAPAKPAAKATPVAKPAAKSMPAAKAMPASKTGPAANTGPAAKPVTRPAASAKPSPAAKSMAPAAGGKARGSLVGSGKAAGSAMNKPMGSMAPAPSAQPMQTFMAEHTVASGETLSHISLKYYNSAAKPKYMVIYEANKAVIGDNPNMIKPGMVLKIPKL